MADSSSFVKREVAMTAAFVTWLLLQVGAYLVGHTHLVSSTEWNALAQFLEPILTAGLLTVVGLVVRNFVTPVWTSVGGVVESQGGSFPDEPDLDPTDEEQSVPMSDEHLVRELNLPDNGTAHADMK